MTMSPAVRGVFLAFIATLLWSGNFIVSRMLASDVPPFTLAFLRWAVALLFLIPLSWKDLPAALPIVRHKIGYFLLAAFFGVACFNSFVYIAGHSTNAINMALLATTSPIFTLLLVWLLRIETASLMRVFALVLAFMGVLCIISRGDIQVLSQMTFSSGDFWALASAFCFAAYSIMVRSCPSTVSSSVFLVTVITLGCLMLLPGMIYELSSGLRIVWQTSLIWHILYLSLGASVISYLCWNKAISLIGAANTSMIYYTLPIMTSLEAVWLLNETIGIYHVIGGVCIVASILMTLTRKK